MAEEKLPRLLMVDDSKTMRRAATKMLGGKFDVVTAEDGVDGWRRLSTDDTIQVVFSDLSMPNLDGYGLLRKIRTAQDPGLGAIPVVIVTGAENDDEAREKALEAGATDFITKPFNSTNLIARATAYSNYQRETQQLKKKVTVDEATGLYNKQYLSERLKKDLSFSARHQQQLSIVFVEIDLFNKIFIKKGKQFSDKVIKSIARILSRNIRREDTAARIGLSQFVLSLPAAEHAGSCALGERIRQEIEDLAIPGVSGQVTVSIGVTTPESHPGQTVLSVLEETRSVMKVAQERGGNSVAGAQSLLQEQDQPVPIPSPPSPPEIRDEEEASRKEISVTEAIDLIKQGKSDAVKPHLDKLLDELRPLLELADELKGKGRGLFRKPGRKP